MVVGSNRGIGFAFAKHLLESNATIVGEHRAHGIVVATCRRPSEARALHALRERFGFAERLDIVRVDVLDEKTNLPAFEDTQQERALALVRGLHSLERGIIRMERLSDPATVVVSDDRGLRRRCFTLANPPVVLGRKQWENWLLRVEL